MSRSPPRSSAWSRRSSLRLGSLDILVNNAGIIRDNLIHKMTDEDWDAVAAVHLKGAFLCSRAAQREMVRRDWGRIVNLSSVSALGNRGQTNYAAAKAGLQGMAKTLAIELGRYGITVNAVAPGFIDTEMTRATAIRLGRDPEEWKEEMAPADPGAPRRRAARHRQRDRLSVQRRGLVRLRPGDLRRRRPPQLAARHPIVPFEDVIPGSPEGPHPESMNTDLRKMDWGSRLRRAPRE